MRSIPDTFYKLARLRLEALRKHVPVAAGTPDETVEAVHPSKRRVPRLLIDNLAVPRNVEGLVEGWVVRAADNNRSKADKAVVSAMTALEAKRVNVDKLLRLKHDDGSVELIPSRWKSLGIRNDSARTTFFELAQRNPGLGHEAMPEVDYARKLIKHFRPEFDDEYSSKERAALIEETCKRINRFLEALDGLVRHLDYGEPDQNLRKGAETPTRDVTAAILMDVHGKKHREISELLGIPTPQNAVPQKLYVNSENAVRRGRRLLEAHFSEEGWRLKAEAMKAKAERWDSLDDLKDQFVDLIAEDSGVSVEEARRGIVEDGFDKTIDEWMQAWAQDDMPRAFRLARSDKRFDLIASVL